MKLIRNVGPWRGWVLLMIGVAIVSWPFPGVGVAQQRVVDKEKITGPTPKQKVREEVEDIQLKYANARDMAGIIQQMVGGRVFRGSSGNFRFTIDERSNSVLVVGDADDIALVKSLLGKLDIPRAGREQTVSTLVYHLRNTLADNNLANSLRLVLDERNFQVDPTRNIVIVSGNQKMQEQAESLLHRLDTPLDNKPTIASEMQVRVVWLASDPDLGGRVVERKAPEDMKDVIQELSKMGVQDPRLVTQTLITALPDRQFELGGLAGQDSRYRLSISGTLLATAGDAGRLRISINALEAKTNATVGRVDTEITAPVGHSVVLGMTPTGNTTSVFVVQILSKK